MIIQATTKLNRKQYEDPECRKAMRQRLADDIAKEIGKWLFVETVKDGDTVECSAWLDIKDLVKEAKEKND